MKELRSLSPFETPRKDPFVTPPNYFREFRSELMLHLGLEERPQQAQPSPRMQKQHWWITSASIAAMFVLAMVYSHSYQESVKRQAIDIQTEVADAYADAGTHHGETDFATDYLLTKYTNTYDYEDE